MNIKNKILKDRKLNICTFTAICRKCGFTHTTDLGCNDGLTIAQMPCPNCDIVIPQITVHETYTEPISEIKTVKLEIPEVKQPKPKPKKKQKNFKMRYK